MFAGSLPTYANVRSVRVAGGLGTIARIVSESEEIYAGPLDVEEGLARIDAVYKPYHRALAPARRRHPRRFRLRRADRLPLDAVDGARRPRPRSGPTSSSATATARAAPPSSPTLAAADPDPPRLFGQPQQALCRRLHHRALRPARPRPARHADRGQPLPLHGRADARADARASTRLRGRPGALRRRLWRRPSTAASSPRRRSGRIGRQSKEKGPLAFPRRPKSREETPKEGSAIIATAPQQLADASHKIKSVDQFVRRTECRRLGWV